MDFSADEKEAVQRRIREIAEKLIPISRNFTEPKYIKLNSHYGICISKNFSFVNSVDEEGIYELTRLGNTTLADEDDGFAMDAYYAVIKNIKKLKEAGINVI